jgi:hypothetical protein
MASFAVEDDPRQAFAIVREGMETVTRLGLQGFTTYLMGNGLGAGEVLGEWDWVETTTQRMLDVMRSPRARAWLDYVAASVATLRGEERLEALEATWRDGESDADLQTMSNAASSLARRSYLRGEFADGLTWLRRGRGGIDSGGNAQDFGFQARLALLAGDAEALAEARNLLADRRGRGAVLAERAMADAALAALAGRRDEAVGGYRVALDRYRDEGMRFDVALTVLEVAAVLGADAAEALGVTAEARATLVDLRCTPLVDRLDSLIPAVAHAGAPAP